MYKKIYYYIVKLIDIIFLICKNRDIVKPNLKGGICMLTWKKKIAVIAATVCFSIGSIMCFAGSDDDTGYTDLGYKTRITLTASKGLLNAKATATTGCEQSSGTTITATATVRILNSSGGYEVIKSDYKDRTAYSTISANIPAVEVEASVSNSKAYRANSSHAVNGDCGYWYGTLSAYF